MEFFVCTIKFFTFMADIFDNSQVFFQAGIDFRQNFVSWDFTDNIN